jgi:DNA-directed RNA polymerase specialized sigma24 family protein
LADDKRHSRSNSLERDLPENVQAARSADDLEHFYRAYFLPLVRRAVRRHGISFEDAGDIVQDAFVLAVGKLDPSKNPKAWLFQVVDHLALNWQRKTIRRARLVARWRGSPILVPDNGGVTDE